MLFAVLSVITNTSVGLTDFNKKSKLCNMERVHRMVGYNCAGLDLGKIPDYLKASTEVRLAEIIL